MPPRNPSFFFPCTVVVSSFLDSAGDGDADLGLDHLIPTKSGIAAMFLVLVHKLYLCTEEQAMQGGN
jgi:hypothetical protein